MSLFRLNAARLFVVYLVATSVYIMLVAQLHIKQTNNMFFFIMPSQRLYSLSYGISTLQLFCLQINMNRSNFLEHIPIR